MRIRWVKHLKCILFKTYSQHRRPQVQIKSYKLLIPSIKAFNQKNEVSDNLRLRRYKFASFWRDMTQFEIIEIQILRLLTQCDAVRDYWDSNFTPLTQCHPNCNQSYFFWCIRTESILLRHGKLRNVFVLLWKSRI